MRMPTLLAAMALGLAGCTAERVPDGEAAPDREAQTAALELDNLRRTLEIAGDKFQQLAEAMPEESYDWRPSPEVRSVGEVFRHVAADNYFVPALMGFEAPEGTGVTSDGATFQAFQDAERTRDEVLLHVEASFDFMLASMDASADELERGVMLGSSETTVGDVWIRAITHLHEHLGQGIAYARSNGVTPPWSR
jgi:uncharacterized damage-inducible protein DinB